MALNHLKKHDVDLEDSGDEIGPKAPGSPIWVFGSSDAFAGQIPAKVDPELDQLTMREREMLRLIVRG
jgi:hypothetical protein